MEILPVVVIFGGVVFLFYLGRLARRERRGREYLPALATSIGLEYVGRDDALANRFGEGLDSFTDLWHSSVQHVMRGRVGDDEVFVLEFMTSGKDDFWRLIPLVSKFRNVKGLASVTYVGFALNQETLPPFRIQPKGLLPVSSGMNLNGHPKFQEQYVVMAGGPNEESVRPLLHDDLLGYLSGEISSGWNIEGGGEWLVLSQARRVPPQETPQFYQEAVNIYQLLIRKG